MLPFLSFFLHTCGGGGGAGGSSESPNPLAMLVHGLGNWHFAWTDVAGSDCLQQLHVTAAHQSEESTQMQCFLCFWWNIGNHIEYYLKHWQPHYIPLETLSTTLHTTEALSTTLYTMRNIVNHNMYHLKHWQLHYISFETLTIASSLHTTCHSCSAKRKHEIAAPPTEQAMAHLHNPHRQVLWPTKSWCKHNREDMQC